MHPEGILPLPLTENLQSQKYRQRDFFSADLYYNDMHSKQKVSVISHCRAGACSRRSKLLSLKAQYIYLSIDQYVIMPNHIHVVLILESEAAGASPRPTITDIVCAYKSLTTRECKKNGFDGKLFQTSFYEHIIRGREDYEEIAKYIYENPIRWYYDELYAEE